MNLFVSSYMLEYYDVHRNITFKFGDHRGGASKIEYYVN